MRETRLSEDFQIFKMRFDSPWSGLFWSKCQEKVHPSNFFKYKVKNFQFLKLPVVFIQFEADIHQSSFPLSQCFFGLFCRINTRWPNTMGQWTLSVKHSGEMRDSLRRFSFLLKGVFESENFQRSKIYILNSRLLTLAFLSTF